MSISKKKKKAAKVAAQNKEASESAEPKETGMKKVTEVVSKKAADAAVKIVTKAKEAKDTISGSPVYETARNKGASIAGKIQDGFAKVNTPENRGIVKSIGVGVLAVGAGFVAGFLSKRK
jgi:hypothetical protein